MVVCLSSLHTSSVCCQGLVSTKDGHLLVKLLATYPENVVENFQEARNRFFHCIVESHPTISKIISATVACDSFNGSCHIF